MMILTIALGVVLGLFLFCFLCSWHAAVFGPGSERDQRRKQKLEERIQRIMADPNWEKLPPKPPYDAANDPWGLLGAVCGGAIGLWLMSVLL
jgi:hypothetical protein